MKIITNNGAAICTPDNFAIKARKTRLKRALRNNLKAYSIAKIASDNAKESKGDKMNIICGALFGLAYMGVLMGITL